MQTQPQLLMLQKTMVVVEGTKAIQKQIFGPPQTRIRKLVKQRSFKFN